ncbi:MAG: type IVB secretion system coupling complex protein DotM/IcmP [Legionellaceae bacterium]|nr:type IVB secretion system coupling complex protein DotM/IcmP [Legionellaceae bacterium]
MAQQQQSQGGGGDNAMAPVWIIILLFFTVFIIWKFAHAYIVAFMFQVNLFEARLVSFFYDSQALAEEISIMQTVNPEAVGWSDLNTLTRNIGNYTRYPLGILLVVMGVWLYMSNITLKFRRVHNLKTLRTQEQNNWPAIMPVVKEDLTNVDINEGPWAMGQSPIEFARKHGLLKKNDLVLDEPMPGLEMTAGIRRGDAKRVFTLQIGPYFQDFNHCPPHVVALAAVFMARINRDKKSATMILETVDKSYVQGKPDFSKGREIVKKYVQTELVQEVLAKHAYVLTMMASLLEKARDDGVVPSAEFLWLKPIDRRLWFMLNCVGRQTPYVEVGGPFAHWKAEKVMGRRCLVPMVDEATNALEIAVKEVKLSPKELQELES